MRPGEPAGFVPTVIARLDDRADRQAVEVAATDVLDDAAWDAGDHHTPTPRQVDDLTDAVLAQLRSRP